MCFNYKYVFYVYLIFNMFMLFIIIYNLIFMFFRVLPSAKEFKLHFTNAP